MEARGECWARLQPGTAMSGCATGRLEESPARRRRYEKGQRREGREKNAGGGAEMEARGECWARLQPGTAMSGCATEGKSRFLGRKRRGLGMTTVELSRRVPGARLPADLGHAVEDEGAVVMHVIGAALQRQGQNGGELSGLLAVDAAGRGAVVEAAGGLRAVDAGAKFDDVEVELENAPFAEDQFGDRDEGDLRAFAEERASGAEEQVFDELLGNGGASANAATLHVVFGGNLYRVPIESMMLVEAGIFRGDDGVLQIARNLVERNEFVALAIGSAVHPGLHAALQVHGGGGRVDPAKSHQSERGKGPKKGEGEEQPAKEGAKKASLGRRRGGRGEGGGLVWRLGHISG